MRGCEELTLTEVARSDGHRIRCIVDEPTSARSGGPVVIVVPPFAKTMRDVMTTALFLTFNGFTSWRFDYCSHIGASDGNVFDFTLTSAIEDVRAVTAAVRSRHEKSPLGIISSSLGSRAVFRALPRREDVRAFVSLVGVVNLRHTLIHVMGEDLVGERLGGRDIPKSREVLGYRVNGRFINDIMQEDLYSLASTKRDVAACCFPIAQISAELDAWTQLDEVKEIFGAAGDARRELYLLSGASHKLENNPSAARDALRQAVKILNQYLLGEEIQLGDVRCPSFTEIVKKSREERAVERRLYRPAVTKQ
jgi:alpha-beta hydrolase superfamily lysophospholipase